MWLMGLGEEALLKERAWRGALASSGARAEGIPLEGWLSCCWCATCEGVSNWLWLWESSLERAASYREPFKRSCCMGLTLVWPKLCWGGDVPAVSSWWAAAVRAAVSSARALAPRLSPRAEQPVQGKPSPGHWNPVLSKHVICTAAGASYREHCMRLHSEFLLLSSYHF